MPEVNPGTIGLVDWWPCDEASGSRVGAHAGIVLTDNNTVLSAAGKVATAADFETSNSEYLSAVDSAALSMGDIDFTVGCWVKLESLPGTAYALLGKYDITGNQREYLLYYNKTDHAPNNVFSWIVSRNGLDTGNTVLDATTFGAATTATWYFVVAYHDSVNNLMGISVNGGAFQTIAHTTGCFDGTAKFALGVLLFTPSLFYLHDGLLDEPFIYKKVLSLDNVSWIYNSGNGRSYADLTAVAGGGAIPASAIFESPIFGGVLVR